MEHTVTIEHQSATVTTLARANDERHVHEAIAQPSGKVVLGTHTGRLVNGVTVISQRAAPLPVVDGRVLNAAVRIGVVLNGALAALREVTGGVTVPQIRTAYEAAHLRHTRLIHDLLGLSPKEELMVAAKELAGAIAEIDSLLKWGGLEVVNRSWIVAARAYLQSACVFATEAVTEKTPAPEAVAA